MVPRSSVLVALTIAFIQGSTARHFDLMRTAVSGREQISILEQAGCIVNGFDQDGMLLVEVPREEVDRLRGAGWRLEMLMEDVTSFYERNAQDYRFHTYTQIKDTFMEMARNNPGFVKFETLGFASNDSLLFALKITDNPLVEEDEPELMFEAAIHGDEKCATEPVFEWAVYLVRNYGVDPSVTYWVNTREIWVQCPTNPYGHIVGQRYNRNGVDCNRDYGFMWFYETSFREGFTQPETRAHLRLMQRNAFNYWSSGHGGTYCISTPWSYSPFGTRDSMEIQYLAQQYHNITGYPYGPGYRVMYQINGASKDYAYGALGGVGWTIETCIYKTPPVESLPQIIAREHNAMRMIMVNIDRGVRGIVTDSITGVPIRARVRPLPIDFPSYCDSLGDYHRYLRPGTYSIVFEANGYRPKTVNGVVVTADTVTYLDVELTPDQSLPFSLHQFVTGRGVSDVQIYSTPDWALGPHDGRRFSLGRGGFAVYDFGTQIINGPGADFTVYEDDSDPEGYRVDVSDNPLGPWTFVGWDTGTASFDLGTTSSFRYIKITDDSGAVSGAAAGFDLDAVEAVVVNMPAVVYYDKLVQDSPPGGNSNGILDPGECAGLVLGLKNIGRLPVYDLVARLSTSDTMISVLDSLGSFGTIAPDSVRYSRTDKFRLSARPNTPREHQVVMKLLMSGSDYHDSLTFVLTVGELRMCDPIPDGPRIPPLYWCYDDTDTGYTPCPAYDWVEIRGRGTRLTLGDDQTVQVDLPVGFGPWRFYGQQFTQISICSNGWVAPGYTNSTTYTPIMLPDAGVPAAVYLNWTDLYPPAGGGVWYWYDSANRR
ncbi:MAG: M14 family zinc carboxypeptidase, partial [candidate division WOR-3 bacterium]